MGWQENVQAASSQGQRRKAAAALLWDPGQSLLPQSCGGGSAGSDQQHAANARYHCLTVEVQTASYAQHAHDDNRSSLDFGKQSSR